MLEVLVKVEIPVTGIVARIALEVSVPIDPRTDPRHSEAPFLPADCWVLPRMASTLLSRAATSRQSQ